MRTKNSLNNIFMSFTNNILLNILRFISRTIFIKYLDNMYLGVNGLLSNVLGILALADLGIGTAIGFSLYTPLANKNIEKIKTLMHFYKKAYRFIAIFVLIIGFCIFPFLDFFIDKSTNVDNLQVYYLVFLFNMIIGYLFSYMRTLVIADQKEYKITKIVIISNILLTIFQTLVIVIFKNYLIYILIQSAFIVCENIIINNYILKKYPYLKDKKVSEISKEDKKKLKNNINAMMFHRVGSYFVDSTDNLIISKFLGLSMVGIYSNYYLITSTFSSFITTALWSTVSSFGNLNVTENSEKKYNVYKVINLLGFSIFGVVSICLFELLNLFIGNIWLGEKYLLSISTVIIICINFYVSGMMHINDAIKSAAGLYIKDKFVPIFQSLINIIFSIILVKYYGITGIFIGTLLSSILPSIIKPIIIYKEMFNVSPIKYFTLYFKELVIIIFSLVFVIFINSKINLNNSILLFIIKGFISAIIPIIIIYIIYRKDDSMKFLKIKVIELIRR